mgnify:CR=1 FL=1
MNMLDYFQSWPDVVDFPKKEVVFRELVQFVGNFAPYHLPR